MLSVAKAAARDASDLIIHANEIDRESSNKSTVTDLVTKTDKNVEKILIEELSKTKKNFSFITEETGNIKNKDKAPIKSPIKSNIIISILKYCCYLSER